MNLLALDIGTSAVKAALFSNGRPGPVARYPIANQLSGVRAEIDPADLLAAVELAARAAAAGGTGGEVDLIAFDTFSAGPIVLSATGEPRTPIITHADRRSTAEALELEAAVPNILALAGNRPFPGGIASSTLRWLAKHSDVLANNPRVGQTSSFVLHAWTNTWLIDPSQAVFLGMFDITAKTWSAELARAVGVPLAALPEIRFADQILAKLTPAAAARLNLQAGTPVLGGLIDTSAALVGAAAPALAPGQLVHSAGSTDVLALILESPRPAPHYLTRPIGTGAHLPERWLAVSTMAAAGSAVAWIRQTMFRELTDGQFDAALRTACSQPLTANSQLPTFDPLLAGDRTDIVQRTAALTHLTLATTREDILAALAQALIAASRTRFENLAAVAPILPTIGTMGGNSILAAAMHQDWPNAAAYTFSPIENEALTGLHILAQSIQ